MTASATQIDFAIREGVAADARALAELRYALRASTGIATEPKADFIERCNAWMERQLGHNQAWQCWVAADETQLFGAIWLQVVDKIPNPRVEPEYHAYITNFYVRETARGRGVGSRLLKTALDWCRTREVDAVILWPTDRSRSLYERHGFAVRDDIMELIIGYPV